MPLMGQGKVRQEAARAVVAQEMLAPGAITQEVLEQLT